MFLCVFSILCYLTSEGITQKNKPHRWTERTEMLCSASSPPSPPAGGTSSSDHHAHLRSAAARSDLPGALAAFVAMSSSAPASAAGPVLRTFTSLLKLCAARADLATGRAVHGQLAARGLVAEALA